MLVLFHVVDGLMDLFFDGSSTQPLVRLLWHNNVLRDPSFVPVTSTSRIWLAGSICWRAIYHVCYSDSSMIRDLFP